MENLEEFSAETLNEMEMGSLLGGNVPVEDQVPDNCRGGNCGINCGK